MYLTLVPSELSPEVGEGLKKLIVYDSVDIPKLMFVYFGREGFSSNTPLRNQQTMV